MKVVELKAYRQGKATEAFKRRIKILEDALRFIYEIAYEDLRVDEGGSGTWSIEAIASNVLGLSDNERDIDNSIDQKLIEMIRHVEKEHSREISEENLKRLKQYFLERIGQNDDPDS